MIRLALNLQSLARQVKTENYQLSQTESLALLEHARQLQVLFVAARQYQTCKHEQSLRAASSLLPRMICLHVVYNGGTQAQSCVAQLFATLDDLKND